MTGPVRMTEVPETDALLFVSGTRPSFPLIVNLSREAPAQIVGDRDRAILRALQRLDDQEK